MSNFTRREMLQMLSILFPVSLHCCSDEESDNFAKEQVCAHIFQPGFSIPDPLLARYRKVPSRNEFRKLFQIGIPELLVCATPTRFLDIFQYVWPITREDFNRLQGSIKVLFEKTEIVHKKDVEELAVFLQRQKNSNRPAGMTFAIVFTLNDLTKYWSADLVQSWQKSNIEELVVFKDPTKSPYLCDYLSLQKGFKKQPP